MACSNILIASRNSDAFESLTGILGEDLAISLVNNWEDCVSRQQQHDSGSLTIIDTLLLSHSVEVSTVTKKIVGKIIIIGQQWPEEKQIEAIACGVSGYCDKNISNEFLCRVINSVIKGEVWVPRHLIPKVISLLIEKNIFSFSLQDNIGVQSRKKELLTLLSDREMQVALMIAKGNANKRIASTLSITERTVKAHVSNIFKKLNVPDRIHLAIFMKSEIED